MSQPRYQNLALFDQPAGFRGRPAWVVQLWWLVQATVFAWSPQFLYGFRRWLLRLFGATVGPGVIVRPTARFQYPWKVSLGENAWIGDDVVVYSLGAIRVGRNAVVSQKCYLCTGSHDMARIDFPIFQLPIDIGEECWLATDVYVAPGVTIGPGAVVGARSSVFKDLPGAKVYVGSPARAIKDRPTVPHHTQ